MMHAEEDTIAAISPPPGEGGVAIIRISGASSFAIADALFDAKGPPPSQRPPGTFAFGRICHQGQELDEVLMLFMRAPRSYTGEDTIEIQGHGGRQCAQRILRAALRAGARLADPGEFTRRAFLNGRVDLLQAEAVLDLIRAQSERAAAAAVEQMEGALSRSFANLYDSILAACANLEATLDFPEDELPRPVFDRMVEAIAVTIREAEALLSTWGEGHLLRDGAVVVISGRPNVGKSTLLNGLLGKDRAIVSPTPGTTRDTIEETLILNGIPVRLIDTAGLRETECLVEREGIGRTRRHMDQADLHLHMVDASAPLAAEDLVTVSGLKAERTLLLLNKVDLGRRLKLPDDLRVRTVELCLVRGEGLEQVRTAMLDRLSDRADLAARPQATISERHRGLLLAAREEMGTAQRLLVAGGEDVVVAVCAHLRAALESLGQVTGRVYHDELLNSIFSRFCIGK